jgi:hypothetical protein
VPGDRLVVFGGCWWGNDFRVTAELREYSVGRRVWSPPLKSSGAVPCARYRHSMVPLPSSDGHVCVLYGGYVLHSGDGHERPGDPWYYYNRCDLVALDTRTCVWTAIELSGDAPMPRGAHSCVPFGASRLLFFGGGGQWYSERGVHKEADCGDLFAIDTSEWAIEQIEPTNASPPPPSSPPPSSAFEDEDEDDSEDGEPAHARADVPSPRGSHTVIVASVGGELSMLVLGGRDYRQGGRRGREVHRGRTDGWLLKCDVGAAPPAAAPAAGSSHVTSPKLGDLEAAECVGTGERKIFGGFSGPVTRPA